MRFVVLLLAMSMPAGASDVGRLEGMAVDFGEKVNAFALARAPELEGSLPDWSWDGPLRRSAGCFLSELSASRGSNGVAQFLDLVENWVNKPIKSIHQFEAAPTALRSTDVVAALESCGSLELMLKRVFESGALEVLMKPGVSEKLLD